jgi:16S rRNA (adenine1518-N6/adenine1519-N6)-dimethyltransferase
MVSETAIRGLAIKENETVIEVGPGHGALTIPLAAHLSSIPGARLIAVERDTVLALEVRKTLETKGYAAEILEGDIRKVLPSIAGSLGTYVLTGNLPYYLTGFFFRLLSELTEKPTRAVLMVQREVAERMTATPPRMNLLAAATQHWTSVSLLATVPVSAFSPRPRVEGALLLLEPLNPAPKTPQYFALVRALFKQPRKKTRNNLASASPLFHIDPHDADNILKEAGIDPDGRPQNISVPDIERLARILSERG